MGILGDSAWIWSEKVELDGTGLQHHVRPLLLGLVCKKEAMEGASSCVLTWAELSCFSKGFFIMETSQSAVKESLYSQYFGNSYVYCAIWICSFL